MQKVKSNMLFFKVACLHDMTSFRRVKSMPEFVLLNGYVQWFKAVESLAAHALTDI